MGQTALASVWAQASLSPHGPRNRSGMVCTSPPEPKHIQLSVPRVTQPVLKRVLLQQHLCDSGLGNRPHPQSPGEDPVRTGGLGLSE